MRLKLRAVHFIAAASAAAVLVGLSAGLDARASDDPCASPFFIGRVDDQNISFKFATGHLAILLGEGANLSSALRKKGVIWR